MRSWLFCLAILAVAPAARAAEPTADEVDRARTFFNAGVQAYSSARYGDAARSFDQAYRLAPRPQLLFSLAQAEKKEFFASNDVSMLRHAIVHYKEYLEQVSSGGRRADATEAKADLEARLTHLDPQQASLAASPERRKTRLTIYSSTPTARATIDGGPPQELPYFGDIDKGKHRVRVFADGYFDEEREVSGDKAIDLPVDLPLKDRPAIVIVSLDRRADVFIDGRIVATAPVAGPIEVPPGPHVLSVAVNGKKAYSREVMLERAKQFRFEPRLETSDQRIVATSLLIAGAVGIVGGSVFAIAAVGSESRASDIDDQRTHANIGQDQLDNHNHALDQRDAFRTTSIASLSIGAGLAAGGVLLYALDKPAINIVPPRSVEPAPRPPTQPLDVAAYPLVGPGLYGAGLGARF